jgi:hypothetical protein
MVYRVLTIQSLQLEMGGNTMLYATIAMGLISVVSVMVEAARS